MHNVELIDHGKYLEIALIWRGWRTLIAAGITVLWGVGVPLILADEAAPIGVYLIFYSPGVFLIYYLAASFFNKTHIFANESIIEVRHRPVPWLGNLKVDVKDINQLYVKKIVHHYHGEHGTGTSIEFQLRAVMHAGNEIKMLSGLRDSYWASFVQSKLEASLHLEEGSIPSEYG